MTNGPETPLSGVLIADFSRVLAGPLCTMMLADLGATVVKVERPGMGDDTRAWGPPFTERGSTYFQSVNRNKRSVVLDLTSPGDRAAARTLAEHADVLVENFRTGTLDRLGLRYDDLAAANPGLVYCSITGYGSGAGAELPGYDFVIQAVGGMMSVNGPAEGPPSKTGVAMADVVTGLHATIGILAALRERDRSGLGQRVEVNLLSSLLSGLVNVSGTYLLTGQVPTLTGNSHPSIAPYEMVRTADRPLVLAVGNDRQFGALCRVLDLPELSVDARFATNPERVRHRSELVALLEDRLSARGASEWTVALSAAGVPCGPVNDMAEAFRLAGELGLEPSREIADPVTGAPVPQVANPLRLSRTPVRYHRPPPDHGADTADVLGWLRGLTQDRAGSAGTAEPAADSTPDGSADGVPDSTVETVGTGADGTAGDNRTRGPAAGDRAAHTEEIAT